MRKRPKRINLKPPGKCIFCERFGNMSKEHIWPEWAAELFKLNPSPVHEEFHMRFTEKTKLVDKPKVVNRQGSVATKKMRVVCEDCNNGWMSELEDSIKPILTPLILGNPSTIDQSQQELVARWIGVKVLVSEQNNQSDVISDQRHRTALMVDGAVPGYLHIWIAPVKAEKWETGYYRETGTLSRTLEPPPKTKKNVQSNAFGFGRLFMFAMGSTGGIDLNDFIRIDERIPKLWPYQGHAISWPSELTLHWPGVNQIAAALGTLIRSDRIKWSPFPST
jgi:hypothetical protein